MNIQEHQGIAQEQPLAGSRIGPNKLVSVIHIFSVKKGHFTSDKVT